MKLFFILMYLYSGAYCESNYSWVSELKGKNANEIYWRLKKDHFFESESPLFIEDFGFNRKSKKSSFSSAIMEVLSGPPDESISPDENTIISSACRLHSCDEKGFIWADLKEKKSIFAIVHFSFSGKFDSNRQLFLASKYYNCTNYPETSIRYIKAWLKQINLNPKVVRCLDGNKVIQIKL